MALSYDLDWEIRTTGDNTNGGAYKRTGTGTDYSQQDVAELSLTDCATASAGSTTLTSSTGGFTAAMVGNTINISSGTNITAGFYEITGYTDTNTVTIDRAPDDGVGGISGATGKVGGALAWPLDGVAQYNKVWIRSGTYTLTNTTVGAAYGPIYLNQTNTGCNYEGYENTRGDLGTPPVFSAGSQNPSSLTAIINTRTQFSGCHIINIKVDGVDKTRNWMGIGVHDYRNTVAHCEAINCNRGFSGNNGRILFSKASFCVTGIKSFEPEFCIAHDCTTGIDVYTNEGFHCLVYNCETGFYYNNGGDLYRCIADNCSSYGIYSYGSYANLVECLVTNSAIGIYYRGSAVSSYRNYFYNNTTNQTYQSSNPANRYVNNDSTSITTSPYVDQANDNYALNNDSTGGKVIQDLWAQKFGKEIVDLFYPDPSPTSASGSSTTGTQIYPFRQFVSDKFGAVLHPLRSN